MPSHFGELPDRHLHDTMANYHIVINGFCKRKHLIVNVRIKSKSRHLPTATHRTQSLRQFAGDLHCKQ